MNRITIDDGYTRYSRVSKRVARKIFTDGGSVYTIAHKMRPGLPFSLGLHLDGNAYKQDQFANDTCWLKGEIPLGYFPEHHKRIDLFEMAVLNFEYYNANCHETGTYAAFYTTCTCRDAMSCKFSKQLNAFVCDSCRREREIAL